tara:strand:- start:183 stop:374 length:192 start_codon:yes stop_codon:yes gene_type:complete
MRTLRRSFFFILKTMKNLATFIIKHFPKLAEEIYYIIERERYNPEPEEYSDEYISGCIEDLPF